MLTLPHNMRGYIFDGVLLVLRFFPIFSKAAITNFKTFSPWTSDSYLNMDEWQNISTATMNEAVRLTMSIMGSDFKPCYILSHGAITVIKCKLSASHTYITLHAWTTVSFKHRYSYVRLSEYQWSLIQLSNTKVNECTMIWIFGTTIILLICHCAEKLLCRHHIISIGELCLYRQLNYQISTDPLQS